MLLRPCQKPVAAPATRRRMRATTTAACCCPRVPGITAARRSGHPLLLLPQRSSIRAAFTNPQQQLTPCHLPQQQHPQQRQPGAPRRVRVITHAAAIDVDAVRVAPPDLPGMQPGGSYDAAANAEYWATRPVPVVARCLVIAAEMAR